MDASVTISQPGSPMTKVTVNEAKERLPELLDEGAKGEPIEITRGDGLTYTVSVVVRETEKRAETGGSSEDNPPFAALRGAGGGQSFSSAEEVDTYLRKLRDEWES